MEISVPSAQLCCEPKNALKKKKVYLYLKKTNQIQNTQEAKNKNQSRKQ